MATDYTPIGPVPSGIANGTIDATSRQLARDMRGKAYGKDVRETIARMTEWHSIRTSASEVLAAQSAASAKQSAQEVTQIAKVSEASIKQSAQNVTQIAQNALTLFNDSIRQQSQKIDNMVVDLTDKDINSAPEIVAARRGKPSLGAKIDEVDAQLEQKANRSFVDSQFSRIVSGAPKGAYTNLTALRTAYPNGADGVYLVLEDGHWYYWNDTSVAWTDGGLYQATLSDGFYAVNLIENGDFSNGLLGGFKSTYSDTSVDNGAINTANGERTFGQLGQDIGNLTVGNKYYVKADITPISQATYISIGSNHSEEGPVLINNPVVGQKYSLSGILTTTNSLTQFFVRHNYTDVSDAIGKKIKVNHVLVIDLTSVFGKGHEPTVTEVDKLMQAFPNRWFNETAKIADDDTVADGSITTPKLADGAVTLDKTAFEAGDHIEFQGNKISVNLPNEVVVKNKINNSDFAQGTSGGWLATNATHSVSNGVLTNTATGTSNAAYEVQSLRAGGKVVNVGHKYYFEARLKVTNADADYIATDLRFMSEGLVRIDNPTENKEYTLKGIFTPTQETDQFRMYHRYASAELATGKEMQVSYVIGIDLTEVFGAGNEPNVLTVDNILSNQPQRHFVDSIKLLKESVTPVAEMVGTANQINVETSGTTHTFSIPRNPTLMRPEVLNTTFGSNIAPNISAWQGINGATFANGKWTVNPQGQLKTSINAEAGAEYEVQIIWEDTNNYVVSNIPRLVVKFGDTTLPGQFVGYSDAGYKFTVKSSVAGDTELILGDGIENWYAVITDIIIRKVTAKVTPSGRLGVGQFDVIASGNNIAIGKGLSELTSGIYNTAYGFDSLRDVTVGSYNTAIGARALQQATTAYHNIGIGFLAMQEMQSGYYNTGVGYSVMRHITTGNWNVAMGNEAMRNISSGIRNTSIGSRSLNDLTTGSFNVALGREAGLYPNENAFSTKTGDNNVFIGYRTGQSHNEVTDESTAVGSYATARARALAIGRKAKAGGVGSVAIGTDSTGVGAEAQNENDFVLGTDNHHVKIPGRFNVKRFTPSGSSDPQGIVGDITSDDSYFYVKTPAGWKRTMLETW